MNVELKKSDCTWLRVLTVVTFCVIVRNMNAQTAAPSIVASGSSPLTAFTAERKALMLEHHALVIRGASLQDIQHWRGQQATRFQNLFGLAQQIAVSAVTRPMVSSRTAKVSANASPALEAFDAERLALENARSEIHNNLLQDLPQNPSPLDAQALLRQEDSDFQQQYAAELQRLSEETRAVSLERKAVIPERHLPLVNASSPLQ
jgi:hypothetical protein